MRTKRKKNKSIPNICHRPNRAGCLQNSSKNVQDEREAEQADGNALRDEVDAEYVLICIDVAVAVLVLTPFVTNKENSQKLFNS